MSEIKLKPCPFCGCQVEMRQEVYSGGEKEWCIYGWHSSKCLFETTSTLSLALTNKRKLAEAWNRRADNGNI